MSRSQSGAKSSSSTEVSSRKATTSSGWRWSISPTRKSATLRSVPAKVWMNVGGIRFVPHRERGELHARRPTLGALGEHGGVVGRDFDADRVDELRDLGCLHPEFGGAQLGEPPARAPAVERKARIGARAEHRPGQAGGDVRGARRGSPAPSGRRGAGRRSRARRMPSRSNRSFTSEAIASWPRCPSASRRSSASAPIVGSKVRSAPTSAVQNCTGSASVTSHDSQATVPAGRDRANSAKQHRLARAREAGDERDREVGDRVVEATHEPGRGTWVPGSSGISSFVPRRRVLRIPSGAPHQSPSFG